VRRLSEHARRPVGRRAFGFTLAEILIAIAIVAILAAAVVPTIMGRLTDARADAIIAEMQTMQNGLMLFYRDMARFPARLDYLNALPSGGNPVLDACGNAIPAAIQAKFRGPYINRSIQLINPPLVTRYTMTTGDQIEAALTRTQITLSNGGAQRVLQIWAFNIESSVSDDIDKKVDGESNVSAGIIQVAGTIVKWNIPIASGAC
jgi:prepilin-type N-terminal cleavage/methylation domain-containing protein